MSGADEQRLRRRLAALERWIARDEELRAASRRLQKMQRELRKLASMKAWRLYLELEAQTNARHLRIVERALAATRRR